MNTHRPVNPVHLVLLLLAGLLSCQKNNNTAAHYKPLELPSNSAAVIDAGNRFAFNFFATSLREDPAPNNKLISPLSIYTALSMVCNGAAGPTRDSIVKTLQLNGVSLDDLNALSKALIIQMPKEDNKVALSIANSIWYNNKGPQPLPSFLDIVTNNYDGIVPSLDFDKPSSVNRINSWVAQKTENKIPSIIDQVDGSTVMFLINAIYFNGSWQYAFKTADTRNSNFYRADGSTVQVPFMNREATLRISSNPAFTLAELPYGSGKGYDMYLVVPANQRSIADITSTLDGTALTNAISQLDSQHVRLSLPKWEYAYTIKDMKPHLAQLGMGVAFGESADFSNMYPVAPGAMAISKAIHKTYIKVSEQGTEAAAVTAIGVIVTAPAPSPPLILDHPFLYVIREKQTGIILFIGVVNDPSRS